MKFQLLTDHIQLYIDACVNPSDLLVLRDMLRDLGDKANNTYMDTPRTYTANCSECRVRFSIQDTPREDRRPDTCVECYEKGSHGRTSGLREAKYDYQRSDEASQL